MKRSSLSLAWMLPIESCIEAFPYGTFGKAGVTAVLLALIKGGVMERHPIGVLSLAIILAALSGATWAGEADHGRQQYLRFCASCHGIDGKGTGIVAKHLAVKTTDLTLLKKNNKGVYPMEHVISAIDGTRVVRTHGEEDMPVWGEVFEKYDKKAKDPKAAAHLKVKVIAEYVSTLQR